MHPLVLYTLCASRNRRVVTGSHAVERPCGAWFTWRSSRPPTTGRARRFTSSAIPPPSATPAREALAQIHYGDLP
jgi:hypothetical protein